jgi:hypothetical protein
MDSVFEGENGFHAGLWRALDGALGVGNPEGGWGRGGEWRIFAGRHLRLGLSFCQDSWMQDFLMVSQES